MSARSAGLSGTRNTTLGSKVPPMPLGPLALGSSSIWATRRAGIVYLMGCWLNFCQRFLSDSTRLAISGDGRHALSRNWEQHRRLVAAARQVALGNVGTLSPGRDLG